MQSKDLPQDETEEPKELVGGDKKPSIPKPKKATKPKKPSGTKSKKAFIPVITHAPVIESHTQLLEFLSKEDIVGLRPLAKVVGILSSIIKENTFTGTMKRQRIGPKEQNKWK